MTVLALVGHLWYENGFSSVIVFKTCRCALRGETSYLDPGEMQVHHTGHVETHTQDQQQQHQHPPETKTRRQMIRCVSGARVAVRCVCGARTVGSSGDRED